MTYFFQIYRRLIKLLRNLTLLLVVTRVPYMTKLTVCLYFQKQPFRGVLRKRRSENMEQIYRKTYAEVRFHLNCLATLLKSNFSMGVLL